MAHVFITGEAQGRNLLPAEKFGTLRLLRKRNSQVHMDPEGTVEEMDAALSLAKPGDYLLPIGDPAAIAIAAILMSDVTGGDFNVLKWDRMECRYYVVPVKIPSLPKR